MKKGLTINLPKKVFSSQSIRNIEKSAIKSLNGDDYLLMERAGISAFEEALKCYPNAKNWQIICGVGNNAGDGMVVARLALEHNLTVSVSTLSSPDVLKGNAFKAYKKLKEYKSHQSAIKVKINQWEGQIDDNIDLIVDAIFGIGLNRNLNSFYKSAIKTINNAGLPIFSIDIPSGIHPDKGKIMGAAIKASTTITFIGKKLGFFDNEGINHYGNLKLCGLGISETHYNNEKEILSILSDDFIHQVLPKRKKNSHKGEFGHIAIVGGGPGMHGAVCIAGEAALRSGAGKVSIFTHISHNSLIADAKPELIFNFFEEVDEIKPMLLGVDVIVIGPGLGTNKWAREVFESITDIDCPMIVDADALNILSKKPIKQENWILTPHPGEAGRLLGISSKKMQQNRFSSLNNLIEKYHGVIVLKGHHTLIGSNDSVPCVCVKGNPGMASAGMGDALTGIIASMIGQGMPLNIAASLGVEIHAKAGDRAATKGQRGLLAGDLINELRGCVNL
jgi:NAD(P)H-hydrate epimerase